MPNLASSSLGLLNDHGYRDMKVLEEKILNIGFKEILHLLKLSLFSSTPTDLFFCKKLIIYDTVTSKPGISAQHQTGNKTPTNSKKMTMKIMVQNSTNKALSAHAEEDFIDFLFSFLTMPLGSVVFLLGGNNYMGSIDNLHKSISNLVVGRYIKSQALKDMLHRPRLAPKYLCKNQIFPLLESKTHFYCDSYKHSERYTGYLTLSKGYSNYLLTFKDPKVQGGFARGPTLFMVTDDLVVTPLSPISTISFLNRLKIPSSDVEEYVFSIGKVETLSILKAALNSTSALSSGLNLILKKLKQEN